MPPHLRRTTTSSSPQKTTTPPNDDGGGFFDGGGGEEEERKCFGGDEKSGALVRPPLQRVAKKKWQPSERVLKLTRKQVEEMRARLNVIATAPEEDEDDSLVLSLIHI